MEYLKERLSEKSTWASVAIGVTGAAALSEPYSYILIGLAFVGALCPEPKKDM